MCSAAAVLAGGGGAGAGGPVAVRGLVRWLQRAQAQAWRRVVRCVSFVLLVGAVGQAVAAVCRTAPRCAERPRAGGCRVQYGRAAAVLLIRCAVRPLCGCSAGGCVWFGRTADGAVEATSAPAKRADFPRLAVS